MSRGVDLSSLSALSDDATLTAQSVVDDDEVNTHRSSRRSLVNNMLTGLRDAESMYAGSGEPVDRPQGKVYFDTATNFWRGYKTASGTPAYLLDASLAYTLDMATGGTGTFRIGGVLNVNTTAVSQTTTDTGVLMTYTLPAATLSRDGQYVHVVCFGTTASGQTFSLQSRFGAAAVDTHSGSNNITDWCIEFWVVRTGAATVDAGSYCIFNRDDTASTTLCDFNGALTPTLANTNAIDINVSAKGGSLTVTQELMIVEFGNY